MSKKVTILCLITVLLSILVGGASGFFMARISLAQGNLSAAQLDVPKRTDPAETTAQDDRDPTETGSSDVPSQTGRNLTVEDIARRCTKSVVSIQVEITEKGYTGGSSYTKTEVAHGTGVIVREDGYIVTCYHVVEGAEKITVIMDDETEYPAELVGVDESFDLAVIYVEASELEAAALGDSDALHAGEGVVIIGNPLGELGFSVSAGVLSATEREITVEGKPLRLLQTDAAVNPGNSGGGMFNMKGQLIGMVNAKMSAAGIEGLAFAIPLNTIQEKIDSIISGTGAGEKVVLGIGTKSAVCYIDGKKVNCVEIASVREDSAAEQAGLAVGDYLLRANGKALEKSDDVVLLVKYSKPGDKIEFEVYRGREKLTVTVTL